MRELFKQLVILHKHWAMSTRSEAILIIGNGISSGRSEWQFLAHSKSFKLNAGVDIINNKQGRSIRALELHRDCADQNDGATYDL